MNNENDSLKPSMLFKHSPEVLAEYEKLYPGFIEKIFSMADKEQKHRHKQEEKSLDADISAFQIQSKQIRLGQILGFLIGIFTVGCGTYAATKGAEISGGFIGTGGVIGLVSTFIVSGRKDSKSS